MFPKPRRLTMKKTGAFNYYIPDNGEKVQDGFMEGNIDINVVSVKQVEPYRAAQSFSHPAFLCLFFVDQENKKLVFERWTSTLKDWLKKGQVYRTYRPRGFRHPRWSVTQRVRDCIRYILHGLMHLHRKGLCFDMDFTKENIVLIGADHPSIPSKSKNEIKLTLRSSSYSGQSFNPGCTGKKE